MAAVIHMIWPRQPKAASAQWLRSAHHHQIFVILVLFFKYLVEIEVAQDSLLGFHVRNLPGQAVNVYLPKSQSQKINFLNQKENCHHSYPTSLIYVSKLLWWALAKINNKSICSTVVKLFWKRHRRFSQLTVCFHQGEWQRKQESSGIHQTRVIVWRSDSSDSSWLKRRCHLSKSFTTLEQRLIIRASFCCSKKVRKLHLFSTKVAFMRRKLHLCAHLNAKDLTQPIFVCADLAKSQDFPHFHL